MMQYFGGCKFNMMPSENLISSVKPRSEFTFSYSMSFLITISMYIIHRYANTSNVYQTRKKVHHTFVILNDKTLSKRSWNIFNEI